MNLNMAWVGKGVKSGMYLSKAINSNLWSNQHLAKSNWICVSRQIQKPYMRDVFYLSRNTKCMSDFSDMKIQSVCYFTTSLLPWKPDTIPLGNDFNSNFNYFLLFSPSSIFDFKTSAPNWSYVFHKVWNV